MRTIKHLALLCSLAILPLASASAADQTNTNSSQPYNTQTMQAYQSTENSNEPSPDLVARGGGRGGFSGGGFHGGGDYRGGGNWHGGYGHGGYDHGYYGGYGGVVVNPYVGGGYYNSTYPGYYNTSSGYYYNQQQPYYYNNSGTYYPQ